MLNLDKKIIVITGGSGLIGQQMVQHIRANGGIAINADISHETDLDAHNLRLDVTDKASIQEGLQSVVTRFGQLDGLVNNAYPRTKDWGSFFEDIPAESWRKNVDFQLNSCFLTCQVAAEIMKKQKSGSIINIASIYGVVGPDFSVYEGTPMTMPAAYSAIKGGMINFTRYLASYLGEYQIRVNTVSPGGIFDQQPADFVEKYAKKVPLKRMGLPEDIAPPVSFLLSDGAAYITGQNLIVDGGWTSI